VPSKRRLRKDIPAEARKTIGTDIKTVQATWPIDKPLVDSLGDGLREVRSTHDKVEYRIIFMLDGSMMVLLHGLVKTTQRTRKTDIETARKRKAIRENSR
jgi:phage-related protein